MLSADLLNVSVFSVAVGFAGLLQLPLQLAPVCVLHSFDCCVQGKGKKEDLIYHKKGLIGLSQAIIQ